MIELPKIKRISKNKDVCKCRPICKNRRREWKGEMQKTSAELLLERKPLRECFKRWPMKVNANSPCPLSGRERHNISIENKNRKRPNIVRICQTPLDDTIDTPYLKFAEMAMKLGAWDTVRARCAFCKCDACCVCGPREYELCKGSPDKLRSDMRGFDARVKRNYTTMRIMYDVK